MQQIVKVEWCGQLAYDAAWDWQKEVVASLTDDPMQADQLILLEHPPTYTLGRRGKLEHLLLDEAALAEQGFTVRWVDRGGDITYHGPGQLVGYPILNLKRLYQARGYDLPDLHGYLRDLEEVIICALAEFNIAGQRYEGYTGVWVDTPRGLEKIAAIGIKISGRGISSHGFALNVNPDLTHFGHIIPCGIRDHGVTSMAQVLARPLTTTMLIQPIITAFQQIFQVTPQYLSAPTTV